MKNKIKNTLLGKRLQRYDYIISKEEPTSFIAESFHKVLVNIDYSNIDNKYKVIQFTSSIPEEGKTTLVANVAYLYALREKKVLIIDLDLRKPKIHRIFRAANEDGLTDYLLGNVSVSNLINKSDIGVDYIKVGQKTSVIATLLESQKLKDLISSLKDKYDYILLDTPPVFNVSDALYISKLADGIVFVVAQGKAKKSVVNEAVKTLKSVKTPIIGMCFTQVDSRDLNHYGPYYKYKYYSD